MSAILYAIVPSERMSSMLLKGWRSGRTNGITVTVLRTYATVGEAHVAGYALPKSYIWSVEGGS